MPLRRNVLIFHQAALGDFVLTWPLAAALGRLMAQSRIIYITHAEKGRLAERVLGVEFSDSELGWHAIHGDWRDLPERPAALLAGAQRVVSFHGGTEDRLARAVAAIDPSIPCLSLRTPSKNQAGERHYHELLLEQLASEPLIHQGVQAMLRWIHQKGLSSRPGGRDGLVIHPGASSPDKCWPLENFSEVARRFSASGRRVRVLLGEVERETHPPGHGLALSRHAEVIQCASLMELHDQLLSAEAFLGNDSGPGHLAAILGKPTLSLFGPSNAAVWRPAGPQVKTLGAMPMAGISVDHVTQVLDEMMQPPAA